MVDFIFEKKKTHNRAAGNFCPLQLWSLLFKFLWCTYSCRVTSPAKTKKKKERIENPCCLLIRKKLRYRANCVLLWLLVWVCSLPGAQRFLWRLESVFAGTELPHHQAKLILIRNSTRDTLFIKYTIEIIVWYRNLWFYVLFMLLCHKQE